MVHFTPLAAGDSDSLEMVLSHLDHSIQYGEDIEPSEPTNDDVGEEEF